MEILHLKLCDLKVTFKGHKDPEVNWKIIYDFLLCVSDKRR